LSHTPKICNRYFLYYSSLTTSRNLILQIKNLVAAFNFLFNGCTFFYNHKKLASSIHNKQIKLRSIPPCVSFTFEKWFLRLCFAVRSSHARMSQHHSKPAPQSKVQRCRVKCPPGCWKLLGGAQMEGKRHVFWTVYMGLVLKNPGALQCMQFVKKKFNRKPSHRRENNFEIVRANYRKKIIAAIMNANSSMKNFE
jgi:hypothetical protein